ncbi:MAG: hypothetical protein JWQ04_2976 [Pedosphaera sp.]|nr:hypothetical protein [Pedosphaera sp.]
MSDHVKLYQEPNREEITVRAYRIYEMEGRPEGKATQHWLQAETQLRAERQAQAGQSPTRAAKSATAASQRVSKARNSNWPAEKSPRQTAIHQN